MLSVLIAALAACAAGPAQVVEKDQISRVRSVGVISAIGDSFRMSEIGFMVFQTGYPTRQYPNGRSTMKRLLSRAMPFRGKEHTKSFP
jgi:hypothetical protein